MKLLKILHQFTILTFREGCDWTEFGHSRLLPMQRFPNFRLTKLYESETLRVLLDADLHFRKSSPDLARVQSSKMALKLR
jgi:hypothetical protein